MDINVVEHKLPMKLADGNYHMYPTKASMVYLEDGTTPIVDKTTGKWTADDALNAQKLGDKLPSEYASAEHTHTADSINALPKDGTAENSLKLNGKTAEYYSNPVELLDNGNFEIAQAGYGGIHGATAYAADRWILQNGTFARVDGINTLTCTSYGFVQQIVNAERGKLNGKAVTVAITLDDDTVHVASATIPTADVTDSTNYLASIKVGTSTTLLLLKTTAQATIVRLATDAGESVSYKHIRLILGTYTADNLPPYRPNGYAVELAECQRYFYSIPSGAGFYGYTGTSATTMYIYFDLPQRMRISGVSVSFGGSFVVKVTGKDVSPKTITGKTVRGNNLELVLSTSGATANVACAGWTSGASLLVSADL